MSNLPNLGNTGIVYPYDNGNIYFEKHDNGNVVLYQFNNNGDGIPLFSFSGSQNITRDIANPNNIKITDSSQVNQNGIVIDYRNINGSYCTPELINDNLDNTILGLSTDFFFEVGQEIVYVSSFNSLPSMGALKKIYITTDNHIQYYWSGSAYLKYGANTSNDNLVLSDTEFRKTFYSSFITGINRTRYIVFPDVFIDGEIEIQVQSDIDKGGILSKVFSVRKATGHPDIEFLTSTTKTINTNGISQFISIGEPILVHSRSSYFLKFPISKNSNLTALNLKIVVFFKTSLSTGNVQDIMPLFNGISLSSADTAALFSRNYETKKFLPVKSVIGANLLVIDPITKELGEASPQYEKVRLSKEILFNASTSTMVGVGVTNLLGTIDTDGTLIVKKVLPSNNLMICTYANKLVNFMGFASENGITMDIYKGHLNSLGDDIADLTLLASLGLSKSLGNWSFYFLGALANLDSGTLIRIGFRDPTGTKTSKVIVEGSFQFL